MNVKNELFKNSIFNFSAYIINLLINLISIPIFAKYLGEANFGLYFLFIGLIGYYSAFDFGLIQGIIKFVSEYFTLNDNEGLNRVLTAAFIINLILGSFVFILIYFGKYKIIKILNVPYDLYNDAVFVLYLVAFAFVLNGFYSVIISSFQAIMKYNLSSKLNIFFSTFYNSSAIIILLSGFGLKELFISYNLVLILITIYALIIFNKNFPYFSLNIKNFNNTSKKIMNFSLYVFLSKISNQINTNFLQFLISAFHSPSQVPYFMVPLKIVNLIQGALANLSSVAFPFTGNLFANKEIEKIQNLIIESTRLVLIYALPIYLYLIMFSYDILGIWLGISIAQKSWFVLSAIAIAYFFHGITITPTNILLGMGYSKIIGIWSSILIPISIITQAIFIKSYSYIGASLSILILSINAILFFIYVINSIFKVKLTKMLNKSMIAIIYLFFVFTLEIIVTTYISNSEKLVLISSIIAITIYFFYVSKSVILKIVGLDK